MRFDNYLQQHAIAAIPVEQFDGLEVDVAGPHDWEAVESRPGMRIWIWPEDPYRQQFCANAVLTMHRIGAPLDPPEAFAMLCDEQVDLVRGCHERYRAWQPDDDGLGIKGMLSLQFDSEVGAIGSASHTRIIPAAQETLIAQLTVTALLGSPANSADIRLSVVPTGTAPSTNETVAGRPTGSSRNSPSVIGPVADGPGGVR